MSTSEKLYLSKSDFKLASNCPTKLFYKKKGYSSLLDDDPYMQLLADGGHMVGKYAQLLYPGGILVDTLDQERAVSETKGLLAQKRVIIFEAAIFVRGMLVRIDILEKDGNHFNLIEVKSSSADGNLKPDAQSPFRGKKGGIESKWVPYLEDVTYQVMALQAEYSQVSITPYLMVPDKSKMAQIEGLPNLFKLKRAGRNLQVDFLGNENDLRLERILTTFNVTGEVDELLPEVRRKTGDLLPFVTGTITKPVPEIGYHCRDCEYRTDEEASGFAECWGSLAKTRPHLFDLYQLGNAGGRGELADQLIKLGKVSLYDIPVAQLKAKCADRQKIQISHTRSGLEYRSPHLLAAVSRVVYPLHFIDFETTAMALPFHKGMHPFELVAFQWSCHTIEKPGQEPIHKEWINLDRRLPNFSFAQSLREAIGDKGTVLTWSPHEQTTLRTIAGQAHRFGEKDGSLVRWIEGLTGETGRLLDMCELTKEHYFHPEMGGSNSIKKVLAAIWRNHHYLHNIPWFARYLKVENGEILSPYKALTPLEIMEQAEVVAEGTGAIRAYSEMLFGESSSDPSIRDQWRDLLLKYCCLDTIAMVIIWTHWETVKKSTENFDDKVM